MLYDVCSAIDAIARDVMCVSEVGGCKTGPGVDPVSREQSHGACARCLCCLKSGEGLV